MSSPFHSQHRRRILLHVRSSASPGSMRVAVGVDPRHPVSFRTFGLQYQNDGGPLILIGQGLRVMFCIIFPRKKQKQRLEPDSSLHRFDGDVFGQRQPLESGPVLGGFPSSGLPRPGNQAVREDLVSDPRAPSAWHAPRGMLRWRVQTGGGEEVFDVDLIVNSQPSWHCIASALAVWSSKGAPAWGGTSRLRVDRCSNREPENKNWCLLLNRWSFDVLCIAIFRLSNRLYVICYLYATRTKTVVICFTTQERSPRHEVAGLPRLLLCKRVFQVSFCSRVSCVLVVAFPNPVCNSCVRVQ